MYKMPYFHLKFQQKSPTMSGSFAKEPYVFREPTNGSHPISSNDIQISCLDVLTDCYRSLLQLMGRR